MNPPSSTNLQGEPSTPKTATWRARLLASLMQMERSLLVLALVSFISSLGISVMLPLIPLYAQSLGASPADLGILISVFAATSAVGQLASGFLLDRFGARGFIRFGIGTYAAANFLIISAQTVISLILYRAIAGIGGGTNLVATRVYLAQVSDPSRMAFANGVLSAAASVGQIGGPAIGGFVASVAGLQGPFLLVGVTSTLALAAAFFLPRPREQAATSQPTAVATSAILSRGALVLLMSQISLMATYGFIITTFAPLATQQLGWSTIEIGVGFSVLGAGSIILGPWLAHLADRLGRRRIGFLGCLPMAFFAIVLVVPTPQLLRYALFFVAGGGMTAYTAAWFALLAETAPAARRGRTFGIVNALSQSGVIIGSMLASLIWERSGLALAMLASIVPTFLAGFSLLFVPLPRHQATRIEQGETMS